MGKGGVMRYKQPYEEIGPCEWVELRHRGRLREGLVAHRGPDGLLLVNLWNSRDHTHGRVVSMRPEHYVATVGVDKEFIEWHDGGNRPRSFRGNSCDFSLMAL